MPRRVYDIDALACPCGARLKFVEVIETKSEAQKLLRARGLPIIVSTPVLTSPQPLHDFIDAVPEEDWDQTQGHEEGFTVDVADYHDPIWDDP